MSNPTSPLAPRESFAGSWESIEKMLELREKLRDEFDCGLDDSKREAREEARELERIRRGEE